MNAFTALLLRDMRLSIRVGGGAIFLAGRLLMLWNVAMTIRQGSAAIPAPELPRGAAAAVAGGK